MLFRSFKFSLSKISYLIPPITLHSNLYAYGVFSKHSPQPCIQFHTRICMFFCNQLIFILTHPLNSLRFRKSSIIDINTFIEALHTFSNQPTLLYISTFIQDLNYFQVLHSFLLHTSQARISSAHSFKFSCGFRFLKNPKALRSFAIRCPPSSHIPCFY